MAAVSTTNINEGGAQAPPSGVNTPRRGAWFNPNTIRREVQDRAARAAQQSREAALSLAAAGIPIFPCKPDKTPLDGLRWQTESTTNVARIEGWWARHPGALPAIDTAKSALVVLDLDRHGDGPDGVAAGESLLGDLHALDAPVTLTRNDGKHVIFRAPLGEKIGNATGSLPAGVDVRGAGYVLAPGATLADGSGWRADPAAPDLAEAFAAGAVPDLPAHVLALIRKRPERDRPEPPRQPAEDGPRTMHNASIGERERRAAETALEREAATLASTSEGGRNSALNGIAFRLGRMVGAGWIERATVERALEGACEMNGLARADGWPSVRATIRSGLDAGIKTPADPLADRERPYACEGRETPRFTKRDHSDDPRPGARQTIIVDGDVIDAETGEIIQEAAEAQHDTTGDDANAEQPKAGQRGDTHEHGAQNSITTIIASSLAGLPVPIQEWIVKLLIPARNVTSLSGDGGLGKSLLALMLAIAAAIGGFWLGFRLKRMKVVFLSAEDEIEELHRRMVKMAPLGTLDNLILVPMAGKDAVLAAPDRNGLLRPTAVFTALKHVIETHRPELVILDTLADLFGGDEIKKVQARQFIALLRGLCLDYDTTIILLSHPSQAGLNSGSGTSGNTAWNNSVRSRLYLERRLVGGIEDDPDLRVLTTKKSNRGPSGGQIVIRYKDGQFLREKESTLNARDAAHEAERVFLHILAMFAQQGRTVSDRAGVNYAPHVFAKHPDAAGVNKGRLIAAMERLFRDGKIKVEVIGTAARNQRAVVITQTGHDAADHVGDEADEAEDAADDG